MRPISQCRSISQPNNAAANLYNIKLALEACCLCSYAVRGHCRTYVHAQGKETEIRSFMNYQTYCKRNESQAASKLKCLLFKRIYTFIKLSVYILEELRFVLTYLPPECTSSTALTTCIVILNIHIFFWRVI